MIGAEQTTVTPIDDSEPGEDEGVLREIDASVGDRKIKWKRSNGASVEKARAKFDELKAKGYAIFAVRKVRVKTFPTEGTTELVAAKTAPKDLVEEGRIRSFEPDADELIAVPPRSGG